MEVFNKNDYKVLECLITRRCDTPFKSLSVKQIINNTGLSSSKVRSVINNFKLVKFIQEGSKDGNNKTFFITKEGEIHFKQIFGLNDDELENFRREFEGDEF